MGNLLNIIYTDFSYFIFVLIESLIIMSFIIKLHNIQSNKDKVFHYLGVTCYNLILLILGIFNVSVYFSLIMGFVCYPLSMKLITKKPLHIAIVEYLYIEFFEFSGSLIFTIIMYAVFSESTLKSMNTLLFLSAYFTIFIALSYISYLTVGKKIFSLISFLDKAYTKNTVRFFSITVLLLLWLSLFLSLNKALRELYEYSKNVNVLFWVFLIIAILVVSIFTIIFILEQRRNYLLLVNKSSKDELTGAFSNMYGMELLNT